MTPVTPVTPEEIVRELVAIQAVEFRPDPATWFTWASGKRAPIYCDNRRIMSHPDVRARIADALTHAVRTAYPDAEVIAGTATAGIAPAAWISERLGLPMVYVRGSRKDHGQGRLVEGRPLDGESVVLIEDLISLGGSAESAISGLREEGGKVIGVQAIFSYGFPAARERFAALGVPWQALTSYEVLLEVEAPDEATLRVLRDWRLS